MVSQDWFRSFFVFNAALVFGVFFILFFATIPSAQANLLLNPTRIILDDRNKSATVTVINQAATPTKYRVTTTLYRYRPNGALEEITAPTPEEDKLKHMVRFSPRQAVLPPRGHQKIRIQFRRHRELAQGEYRVHLKVNPIPDVGGAESNNQKPGMKIKLLVGVAIPVIIRNGKLWASAAPVSCKPVISKHNGLPALEVTVQREGTRSVIMDIEAYHLQSGAPDGKFIGDSRRAVIYPDFDTGTFEIFVDKSVLGHLIGRKIRIDIKDSETGMRKGVETELLGTGEFQIGPLN